MKVTMNMSNYEIRHETLESEYGDEVLFAGWNPEVDTACQLLQLVPATEQPAVPTSITTEVVALFLRKIYSLQRG